MNPQRRSAFGRTGFTLVEMLVTLGILATIAAVLMPSVLQQVNRGEAARVAKDLKNVGDAAKYFNADVQRWPASLTSLSTRITTATTDLYGYTVPADLVGLWRGPYIDRGGQTSSGLVTGYGGVMQNAFNVADWNGSDFLVVQVTGIASADATKIDQLMDGTLDPSGGQVRHDGSTTLTFFAIPVLRP